MISTRASTITKYTIIGLRIINKTSSFKMSLKTILMSNFLKIICLKKSSIQVPNKISAPSWMTVPGKILEVQKNCKNFTTSTVLQALKTAQIFLLKLISCLINSQKLIKLSMSWLTKSKLITNKLKIMKFKKPLLVLRNKMKIKVLILKINNDQNYNK